MIAIEIQQIRKFMKELLLKDTFDRFLLTEAQIVTFNTFHIDGEIREEFFEKEREEGLSPRYSYWKTIKPYCLQLIRGKQMPLRFKLVFSLGPEDILKLLRKNGFEKEAEDICSLSFVIHFEKKDVNGENEEEKNSCMNCVTGFSRRNFTVDRSAEQFWDETMQRFIERLERDASE